MHLYAINADSYLVTKAFAPLFEAEEAMPDQISALVAKTLAASSKEGVLSLVIFGSMARGTARPGSDLDLCVILRSRDDAKVLEPRIETLRFLLFKRFNLSLSPYVQTLAEMRRKREGKLALVREILNEGRTIYGKELKELLA